MAGVQLAVSLGRSNAIWSLVANIAYAASQWVLLVVLARLSDARTLGAFSLALAIAAPVFMATNMRLRFVQSADFSCRWAFADFLKIRIGASGIGILASLLFCLAVFGNGEMLLLLAAVGLFKAVEAVQDICIGAFQKRSQMRLAAVSTLASGVLVVVAFSVTFWNSHSLVLAAFALALVRMGALLLLDVPMASRVSRDGSGAGSGAGGNASTRDGWRSIVANAWPLGIVAALDSLNAGVPRYFLASSHGNAELGSYAAMSHVAFAGFVLVNAFGQSMAPALASRFGIGDRPGYKALATRLLGLALMIGLVGVLGVLAAGDWLIRILYGDGFDVSVRDFAFVMAAGAMSYVSLAIVYMLSSAQRMGVQAWVYGTNFAIVTLLSWILVPHMSIAGAALALVVAHIAQALLSVAVITRLLKRPGVGGR